MNQKKRAQDEHLSPVECSQACALMWTAMGGCAFRGVAAGALEQDGKQ